MYWSLSFLNDHMGEQGIGMGCHFMGRVSQGRHVDECGESFLDRFGVGEGLETHMTHPTLFIVIKNLNKITHSHTLCACRITT